MENIEAKYFLEKEYLENTRIDILLNYFYDLHDNKCNHKYDEYLPYSFHLKAVDEAILFFKGCLPNINNAVIYARIVGAGHDSIEDARITFNNIKQKFNLYIAESIFGCSESTGRTREERKDEAYYKRLNEAGYISVYVKLCDIVANTNYSILTFNTKMLEDKRKDFKTLLEKLELQYTIQYRPIIEHLEYLYGIKI